MTLVPHPESRIERELAKVLQVPVPYNHVRDLPYGELGHRRLELLLYVLFRRGLEQQWFEREFDAVQLATAPSAIGRLVLLLYRKETRGAVLVRPRPGPLTPPDLARDLIRFLLFHLAGVGPAFRPEGFHLFLAAPGGVNDKARAYAADVGERLARDPRLPYWTRELLDSHARLEGLSAEDALRGLEALLPTLGLELILPEHLDRRLGEEPDIKSIFFGVEMVTSEQVLKRIVSDFQLKALEEDEARQLAERLDRWPRETRMGAGLINFFGYPKEFLQTIARSDKLRAILMKGAEFKTEIDYAVVAFLHEKAVFYATVLLADVPATGDLARLAVVPYVFSRFVIKYVKNANSKVLDELVRSGQRKDFYEGASVEAIKADLLAAVRRLDTGAPPPSDADPRERQRHEALRRAREAYRSEEALAQRFDEDWAALAPVLAAIDKRMLQVLPRQPVIVLDDLGALDQEGRFTGWLEALRRRFAGG